MAMGEDMTDHAAKRILRVAGCHIMQTGHVLVRADLSGCMYEHAKHLSGMPWRAAAKAVVDEKLLRKGGQIWIAWTNNYLPGEDGYRCHASTCPVAHPMDARSAGRAICGAPLSDGSGMQIPEDSTPGCIKCRRLLRAWGVMEENE